MIRSIIRKRKRIYSLGILFLVVAILYLSRDILFELKNSMKEIINLASGFNKAHIETTLREYTTRVIEEKGDALLVAALETNEIISTEDTLISAWGWISLGTTISEIRVPVTYRYHILLSDRWSIEIEDNTCLVFAPRIRATQPPAIHTNGMQKKSDEGWLRFNADEQMSKLEKKMTPWFSVRAMHPDKVALILDPARKAVKNFVKAWMLKEDYWREDRFSSIKVFFPREKEHKSIETTVPTLSDSKKNL